MYKEIMRLKRKGNSKAFVAKELGISRRSVIKYWDMSEAEYQEYLIEHMSRGKEFDQYKNEILEVYEANEFKKLQASSVYDYLEEMYSSLPATEKSLRNYIHFLLDTGQLTLKNNVRMYQQVPELPMGKQLQIDFGEYTMRSGLKLYIFGAVLSSSRYKYVSFQTNPFKTKCLIDHLIECFEYIGGIPEEIVIDQDSIMVVSENYGDIIYTKDFSTFKEEMDFKVYTCRKNDPESKGKIENVIKFVKYNFLSIRNFKFIEEARNSLLKWLVRRANGKISQATKKIPAIAFETEKEHLKPLKNSIFRCDSLIAREDRIVSEKSYISCNGSLYSVPIKYKNRTVDIYPSVSKLFVFDRNTGEEIARHDYSLIPGKKVTIREHFREPSKKPIELKQEVLGLFEDSRWKEFVEINYKSFPRYTRDQCILAKKFFSSGTNQELLTKSLDYCLENKTYSYTHLFDAYTYFEEESKATQRPDTALPAPLDTTVNKQTPTVAKRDISVYSELIKNGKEQYNERI